MVFDSLGFVQDLKQRVCGDMVIDADVLERNTTYEYVCRYALLTPASPLPILPKIPATAIWTCKARPVGLYNVVTLESWYCGGGIPVAIIGTRLSMSTSGSSGACFGRSRTTSAKSLSSACVVVWLQLYSWPSCRRRGLFCSWYLLPLPCTHGVLSLPLPAVHSVGRFVWGRSRLPKGEWPCNNDGRRLQFQIVPKNGGDDSLPLAHACFFQVSVFSCLGPGVEYVVSCTRCLRAVSGL